MLYRNLLAVSTFLLFVSFFMSGCRKDCRTPGAGGYLYAEEGIYDKGPCLEEPFRFKPKIYVNSLTGRGLTMQGRNLTLSLYLTDRHGLDHVDVTFRSDATAESEYFTTTVELDGYGQSVVLDVELPEEFVAGKHYIDIYCEDEYGTSETKLHAFEVVDRQDPETIEMEMAQETLLGDGVRFNASFQDPSGIQRIHAELEVRRFIREPGTGEIIGTSQREIVDEVLIEFDDLPETAEIRYAFTSAGLPLGYYTVLIDAFDAAGNRQGVGDGGTFTEL